MPPPAFPPTSLSDIPPGTEIPEKIYLLRNETGAASLTLVDGSKKQRTFQLVFTSFAKAQRFVHLLGQPSGPMKIVEIAELDSKSYLDRPNAPRVVIDVDPRKLLAT